MLLEDVADAFVDDLLEPPPLFGDLRLQIGLRVLLKLVELPLEPPIGLLASGDACVECLAVVEQPPDGCLLAGPASRQAPPPPCLDGGRTLEHGSPFLPFPLLPFEALLVLPGGRPLLGDRVLNFGDDVVGRLGLVLLIVLHRQLEFVLRAKLYQVCEAWARMFRAILVLDWLREAEESSSRIGVYRS